MGQCRRAVLRGDADDRGLEAADRVTLDVLDAAEAEVAHKPIAVADAPMYRTDGRTYVIVRSPIGA